MRSAELITAGAGGTNPQKKPRTPRFSGWTLAEAGMPLRSWRGHYCKVNGELGPVLGIGLVDQRVQSMTF